jgi:hypothetical protein
MNPSSDANASASRFEKLLVALADDGVDFALGGGLAVIFNGYPRLTLDVDILVDETPENLRKLLGSLSRWGEGWARELKLEDFGPQPGAVRVTEDFDLDIFTRMNERPLDYFRRRLRFMKIGTAQIPYLSPADLIFLKQDSGRDKDRLDVAAMKEILARESQ